MKKFLLLLTFFFASQSPDGVRFIFGPFDTPEQCEGQREVAASMIGKRMGWVMTDCFTPASPTHGRQV